MIILGKWMWKCTQPKILFICQETADFYEVRTKGKLGKPLFRMDIEFKADDPSTVFVAVSNVAKNRFEIWKSTDNGLSFTPKTTGWYEPTNPDRPLNWGIQGHQGAKIASSKADPNRLYALLLGLDKKGDADFIGVFRSDNAGETWRMPYDQNKDGQPNNQYGGPYSSNHWCLTSINETKADYDQGWYNADIDVSDTNPIWWLSL